MADEIVALDHEERLARSPMWWLRFLRPSVWGPEMVWPASFGVGGILVYKFIELIGSDPAKA